MRRPRVFFLQVFVSLGLLVAAATGIAGEVRPFVPGSLAKIAAERAGRPFIVAFWSVTCTHCPNELKALGALKKANPKLDVVLVAADSPEEAPQTAALAARYGLAKVEQWVFSDDMPERLRYEIDPRWHGELPRTHFYDAGHRLEAVAGVVPPARLTQWAKELAR
jgi:thiol-disulfide isomerase/thioredoxin